MLLYDMTYEDPKKNVITQKSAVNFRKYLRNKTFLIQEG